MSLTFNSILLETHFDFSGYSNLFFLSVIYLFGESKWHMITHKEKALTQLIVNPIVCTASDYITAPGKSHTAGLIN
jgi:hypothetical protein